ncbi:putative E3 ubiquitin-protein ligase herc1, partial [Balamuthia mandrillaris]
RLEDTRKERSTSLNLSDCLLRRLPADLTSSFRAEGEGRSEEEEEEAQVEEEEAFREIRELDLSGNDPALVTELTALPPYLQSLCLSRLSLTHGIPSSWALLQQRSVCNSLLELDLSHNQLVSVPAELTQLKALQALLLHHNQLTALSFPREIGHMALKVLTWEGNASLVMSWDAVGVRSTHDALAYIRGEFHGVDAKSWFSGKPATSSNDEEEIVWMWGQLQGGAAENLPKPLKGLFNDRAIVQVASSGEHSVFLTDMGEVWTVGSNSHGQLGLGHKIDRSRPEIVEALRGKRIVQVCCGQTHSLVLDATGNVYSFGSGRQGRLGNGGTHGHCIPTPIKALLNKKIVQIASGAAHSLCVDREGTVYSWGLDQNGRLGRSCSDDPLSSRLPHPVPLSPHIKRAIRVAAGSTHSLVLTEDNTLWGWGNNFKGQLGLSSSLNDVLQPTLIDISSQCRGLIQEVVASAQNTMLRVGDQVGVLQHKAAGGYPMKTFEELKGIDVHQIACGTNHFMVLTSRGEVWVWGSNTYGQLGNGDPGTQPRPIKLKALEDKEVFRVACSRDSSIAILGMMRVVLGEDLKNLLWSDSFADVTFLCKKNEHEEELVRIPAHRVILFLRCPNFIARYLPSSSSSQHDEELQPTEVKIDDIDANTLRTFLSYLYTDRLDMTLLDGASNSNYNDSPIYRLAKRFKVTRLAMMWERDSIRLQESTLAHDMRGGVGLDRFADVRFVITSEDGLQPPKRYDEEEEEEEEKGKEKEKGGNVIYAHKAILSARCEYFATLFLGAGKDMKEGQEGIIHLPDFVDRPTFETLLDFLYTDEGKEPQNREATDEDDYLSADMALSLLSVCNLYGVHQLKERCQSIIQKAIEPETVAFVWQHALLASAVPLQLFCEDYGRAHRTKVKHSEAFRSLPKQLQEQFCS